MHACMVQHQPTVLLKYSYSYILMTEKSDLAIAIASCLTLNDQMKKRRNQNEGRGEVISYATIMHAWNCYLSILLVAICKQ